MSTFLELCGELAEECGISGAGGSSPFPAAVKNQTGEARRVVNWIARAYQRVQNRNANWDFLRSDFTFPTNAGNNEYTIATANLPELKDWRVESLRNYLASIGTNDEQWMEFVPWERFRDAYLFSANRNVPGRPYIFTVRPEDKAVITFPKPDAIYTISGEYWKRAQVMVESTDVPLFPADFHDVLVARGMMYYGAFEGAPEVYAEGQDEYNRVISLLEADQLPEITTAGAMA